MDKPKCSCGSKLRITGTFAAGNGGSLTNFFPRPTGERICESGHRNMLVRLDGRAVAQRA